MNLRKHVPDPGLFWLCLAVSLVGLVAIWDAGYARTDGAVFPRELRSQAVYLVLALALFLLGTRLSPKAWRWLGWLGLLLSFGALIAVRTPGIGQTIGGAQRWLRVGQITVQPSEFIKLAAIMFLAATMAGHTPWREPKKAFKNIGERIDRVWIPKLRRGFPFFCVMGLAVLVERQPDLATASVIVVASVAIIVVAGVTRKSFLVLTALFVVGVGFAVVEQPYRLNRFKVHSERWDQRNILDGGYQTVVSETALARGGLLGVGIGNGTAKTSLPAPTTDFVLATVGEEFGLLGVVFVVGLLASITLRLYIQASRAPDVFGRLVLVGLSVWIGSQTCVSVLMVNGALPPIGIPLPFVSYGGSSLVALWTGVGIAMSLQGNTTSQKEVAQPETGSYGWRDRRARISSA